jgi:hypothetical protein
MTSLIPFPTVAARSHLPVHLRIPRVECARDCCAGSDRILDLEDPNSPKWSLSFTFLSLVLSCLCSIKVFAQGVAYWRSGSSAAAQKKARLEEGPALDSSPIKRSRPSSALF